MWTLTGHKSLLLGSAFLFSQRNSRQFAALVVPYLYLQQRYKQSITWE